MDSTSENKTIPELLKEAQHRASFSVQDMVTWFECHYSTMHSWLRGITPQEYMWRTIKGRLEELQWAINANIGLPVPLNIPHHDRRSYIEKVKQSARDRNPDRVP